MKQQEKSVSDTESKEVPRARIRGGPSSSDHDRELSPTLWSKRRKRSLDQLAGSPRITALIDSFDMKDYTNEGTAFHNWAEQDSKVLSCLAWTVLALPTTQVSVERLFSGVKYILSDLRNSLAEDTLQTIMLQRTNI